MTSLTLTDVDGDVLFAEPSLGITDGLYVRTGSGSGAHLDIEQTVDFVRALSHGETLQIDAEQGDVKVFVEAPIGAPSDVTRYVAAGDSNLNGVWLTAAQVGDLLDFIAGKVPAGGRPSETEEVFEPKLSREDALDAAHSFLGANPTASDLIELAEYLRGA
jgi:hypothetical protein